MISVRLSRANLRTRVLLCRVGELSYSNDIEIIGYREQGLISARSSQLMQQYYRNKQIKINNYSYVTV